VIGSKVLDASALAALVGGRLSALAWFATAKTTSLTLNQVNRKCRSRWGGM